MTSAYDFKGLIEILKSQGLEVAEESAKVVIKATFQWLKESAEISENKYDDLAVVLYPQLEKYALEQAEKINPVG
jgi:hypothetical protein